MKAVAVHRGAKESELVGRVLCQDIRGDRNEFVFRKGHVIRADDVPILSAAPWTEIHLIEMGRDDVGQREAGQRLADSLSSAGTEVAPAGHRHVLKARHHGLLKIDVAALHRLNSIPGVAVFTLPDNQVVSTDEIIVEAQITPLAIEGNRLDEAEHIARGGAVVRLLPFTARNVVVWMRNDRLLRPLTEKLRWFGCRVQGVVDLARDATSIRRSLEQSQSKATLFVVSGSNALDPLDPVFTALDEMGAKMQRLGMPVHPGTLLWIASLGETTIIGLPSCGLGGQVTAFDLILPRILAEGGIGDEDIAAMGHGGILRRPSPAASRHPLPEGEGNHDSPLPLAGEGGRRPGEGRARGSE